MEFPSRHRYMTTYWFTREMWTSFFSTDNWPISTCAMSTIIILCPNITILIEKQRKWIEWLFIQSYQSTYSIDMTMAFKTNTVSTNGTTLTRDKFKRLKKVKTKQQWNLSQYSTYSWAIRYRRTLLNVTNRSYSSIECNSCTLT